jgi:ribosomal-protein-alanine N-acetyltransferase
MNLAYPDPPLVDDLVQLRPWKRDDLDCVREAATDRGITAGTTVPEVFTTDGGLAYIQRQQARLTTGQGIALATVERATQRAVGHMWLGVRPQPAVLGIGYWVIPSARRRGFAGHAALLTARWALEALEAVRVEAWVDPDNQPSLRLLIAAGFVREGLLRSFLATGKKRHDMVVLSLIAADLTAAGSDSGSGRSRSTP